MVDTEAGARQQLHTYFLDTLRILPTTFSLARCHPELPPHKCLHPGITAPCNDDEDSDGNGPRYFDISYWIVGVALDVSDEYFDRIIGGWSKIGWQPRALRDTRRRVAYARTADQYGLNLIQSIDGYLSLAGSTPAFPADAVGGEPMPEAIAHPNAPIG